MKPPADRFVHRAYKERTLCGRKLETLARNTTRPRETWLTQDREAISCQKCKETADAAARFVEANERHRVVSGRVYKDGRFRYTLEDGSVFRFPKSVAGLLPDRQRWI